ncbi:MAG: TlpA family protein disulfide reductase [Oxalobacteraceae bacterium]|nr:TlpA family protein disulfide reductase [Oxalobacteraceae bacterium]
MKKITTFVVIAILFTAIGIYFGAKRFQPTAPADTAVGALMQVSLKDSGGRQRKMSEWQGKVLLINFWATWCPPCVSEMPDLVALQNDLAGKNLQVVGIGIDSPSNIREFADKHQITYPLLLIGIDSPSNIREFADKHQITYPLLLGGLEGSELSRQFGNESGGLPFTILIGADGSVRKTYMGRLDMEKVRADLASM